MSLDQKSRARPISPHLTIYKPQISSVLSIGHRMSGVGLSIIMFALCWWFVLWVFSEFDSCYIKCLTHPFMKIIWYITSFALFYHFTTGIRHLVWDTGIWFSIRAVNISGWFSIIIAFVMTVIFWLGM